MKKIILALVAAAGLYAVAPAPASAQTTSGMERNSFMDANAQMMGRDRMMMRRDRMRMERRMMRREMMRRDMRRMDRRRMMMR